MPKKAKAAGVAAKKKATAPSAHKGVVGGFIGSAQEGAAAGPPPLSAEEAKVQRKAQRKQEKEKARAVAKASAAAAAAARTARRAALAALGAGARADRAVVHAAEVHARQAELAHVAQLAAMPPRERHFEHTLEHLAANDPQLSTLSFFGHTLGAAGAARVAGALGANTALTALSLGHCGVGDEGATALAEALRTNTALRSLDLRYNSITDGGCAALERGLRASLLAVDSQLHAVDLEQWGQLGGARQRASVADPAKDNRISCGALRSLRDVLANIAAQPVLAILSDPFVQALAAGDAVPLAGVTAAAAGAALDLSQRVGPTTATDLARALERNSSLTAVDVSMSMELGFGAREAEALARSLRRNSSLTDLALRHCAVGDSGAVALAKSLRKNAVLTRLDLRCNAVGGRGADALARMLRHNDALTSLDLASNQLDRKATAQLRVAAAAREARGVVPCLILDLRWNDEMWTPGAFPEEGPDAAPHFAREQLALGQGVFTTKLRLLPVGEGTDTLRWGEFGHEHVMELGASTFRSR